ncbi:unnamed protein product [Vicia faba]|uniref:Uncharacterized protein n=1 Tax=Vicia faba TaxID=3906 RepID=A0AAV0ZXX7_VICFA|nr:unnamed protein product [Vicia faba]
MDIHDVMMDDGCYLVGFCVCINGNINGKVVIVNYVVFVGEFRMEVSDHSPPIFVGYYSCVRKTMLPLFCTSYFCSPCDISCLSSLSHSHVYILLLY